MLPFLKKAISFVKKAFFVIAVYFVVVSLFFHFISKDKSGQPIENSIERNRVEIYKVLNDLKSKDTKEGKITLTIYRSMVCGMIGEACTDNPADGDKNFNHSLFGYMTNLIVLPYANPPASGVYWAYSGLQNAGFVPKTYAAEGIGFSAIKPYSKLWSVFRTLAYMILVLILIAIGFMIMFRMKINPQTVIAVENALPRIIISLLLITFSFAIAGFLIDLMYLLITIIISLLINIKESGFEPSNKVGLINKYASGSFSQIWPNNIGVKELWQAGFAVYGILPRTIGDIIRFAVIPIVGYAFSIFMAKKFNWLPEATEGVSGNALGTGIGLGKLIKAPVVWLIESILVIVFTAVGPGFVVGIIVIGLTLTMLLFRIFFILLKTYIQIMLLIIFSPIILMFEAIPGKNVFSYWFKNLLANLLIFPLIILLLTTGSLIVSINTKTGPEFWAPPFLYGMNPQSFSIFLGMGIILLIPDLIKAFKELLGAKGLPVDLGLGTFTGGAGAPLSGGMGILQQFSTLSLGIQGIKTVGGMLQRKKPEEEVPTAGPGGSDSLAALHGIYDKAAKKG